MSCIFTNDGGVSVSLIEHPYSQTFASRNGDEALFRQMHTYLMDNGIIKNNIIDLGAWIGDNTIPWAKRSDAKQSVIYAIDPSKDNCEFIQKMCDHNQINNVKIFQNAISNKMETISTNYNMYHCTFVKGGEGRNKVDAITLDYLFENREIENIGYIHLDVEGMEYNVILGSEKIINTFRPIITFEQHLEIDDYSLIYYHLTSKEYIIFLIDEVLPSCRPDCRNSIAFPKEIFDQSIVDKIHKYIGREILLSFF